MSTRLTAEDKLRIAEARALAGCESPADLREYLAGRGLIGPGEFEGREIGPFALGVARAMLGILADRLEAAGGDG